MTEAIYMNDSYLKEFEATVKSVKDEKFIVLDKTAFYPNGGGQPFDTGKLIGPDGAEYNVVFVGKFNGEISHEIDRSGLKEGDKVKGVINWERRYAHMRYHTTAHIISAVLHKETGAKISGNQIYEDKLRIDFDLENFDKDALQNYVDKANNEIKKNVDVEVSYLKREEAMKIPGIVKLAGALPPSIDTLRIVKIGDIDMQADGGTHVKNTSEIGTLELVKTQNKGKNNRRIYVKLS